MTSTLSEKTIRDRLENGEIFASPCPPSAYISDGTIDLRVGSEFKYSVRSSMAALDVSHPEDGDRLFHDVHVTHGDAFVLQPKQFALASTLEYIALPADLSGILQSRSTYGRMGLVAVAAAWVAPSYRGSPTLELFNAGDVALAIPPGEPICQLILLSSEDATAHRSRYQCHTRPYFAQASVDRWLQELDRELDAVRASASS